MPAEHRGPQRLAKFRSRPDRPDQRHDPEDESQRRHQDRTQAQPGGLDRRRPTIATLVLKLLGELDDQNRVLGGEADEHDEPDLREDVVVLSRA